MTKELYNLTLTKLGNMLKSKKLSNTDRMELLLILQELRGFTPELFPSGKTNNKQKE